MKVSITCLNNRLIRYLLSMRLYEILGLWTVDRASHGAHEATASITDLVFGGNDLDIVTDSGSLKSVDWNLGGTAPVGVVFSDPRLQLFWQDTRV